MRLCLRNDSGTLVTHNVKAPNWWFCDVCKHEYTNELVQGADMTMWEALRKDHIYFDHDAVYTLNPDTLDTVVEYV